MQVGNTEREKEMKQEQEKLEKRIGLLNYLVDKDSTWLHIIRVTENIMHDLGHKATVCGNSGYKEVSKINVCMYMPVYKHETPPILKLGPLNPVI